MIVCVSSLLNQYHVGLNYLHFAGEFDKYVSDRLDYYLENEKYSLMKQRLVHTKMALTDIG